MTNALPEQDRIIDILLDKIVDKVDDLAKEAEAKVDANEAMKKDLL